MSHTKWKIKLLHLEMKRAFSVSVVNPECTERLSFLKYDGSNINPVSVYKSPSLWVQSSAYFSLFKMRLVILIYSSMLLSLFHWCHIPVQISDIWCVTIKIWPQRRRFHLENALNLELKRGAWFENFKFLYIDVIWQCYGDDCWYLYL